MLKQTSNSWIFIKKKKQFTTKMFNKIAIFWTKNGVSYILNLLEIAHYNKETYINHTSILNDWKYF